MGDTLFVEVRDTPDAPGVGDDNSIMLRLQGTLDGLSDRLGVARLSGFIDTGHMAAEAAAWLRQADEGEPPDDDMPEDESDEFEPQWFDAEPALAAVRALVAHLERHPDDLGFRPDPSRAHWPGLLMEELRGCESALAVAVARGREFRFVLVS
jgi:hypothetical protein